jgi:hypothetical protein
MSSCRSALLALACLTAVSAVGCNPAETAESLVALGSYSIDHVASSEATLPVWQADMERRADKEIADLVASPPAMIAEMRKEQAKTAKQDLKRVPLKVKQIEVELTLSKGKKFKLTTKIPGVSEDKCSGLWAMKEGELYLVRDRVDGQELQDPSSLRLKLVDGGFTLKWPGLSYVLVLRQS